MGERGFCNFARDSDGLTCLSLVLGVGDSDSTVVADVWLKRLTRSLIDRCGGRVDDDEDNNGEVFVTVASENEEEMFGTGLDMERLAERMGEPEAGWDKDGEVSVVA